VILVIGGAFQLDRFIVEEEPLVGIETDGSKAVVDGQLIQSNSVALDDSTHCVQSWVLDGPELRSRDRKGKPGHRFH
jgi:hypothetical protein